MGETLTFGHPEMLAWLWSLIPLGLFLIFGHRLRRTRLTRFLGAGRPEIDGGRAFLKAALTLLAATLVLLALARPRWGFDWVEVKRRGMDVVIAVDVSRSMLAEDVKPNRLSRAKREIIDLLTLLRGDRVGLVAFAGQAFVQCPVTEDYGAVRMFLDYLDTELIPVQGTSLGEAVLTALKALDDGSPDATKGRAILLITDGEDLAGEVRKAADAAKEKGVKLYTVGIGSPEGAPIPEPGGGFKKDTSGNVILSRPDEAALQQIAVDTGGLYVRSVAGDEDLAKLYGEGIAAGGEAREWRTSREKRWHEQFQWFLLAALMVLALEQLLVDVRRGRTAAVLGIMIVAASLPASRATAGPTEEAFDAAVADYRAQKFAEAADGFAKAAEARDPEIAEKALFNLGNAKASLGQFDEAIKAYESALALDGSDQRTKDNLEYVKTLKDQKHPEQEEQKKQQDQQQNQDQKQNQDQQQKQDQQQNQDQQQSQDQQQNQDQQQKQDEQQQSQGQDQQQKQDEQKKRDEQQQSQSQDQQKQDEQAEQEQQQQAAESPQDSPETKTPSSAARAASQAPASEQQADMVLRAVQDQAGKYLYSPQGKAPPRDTEKDW